MPARYQFKPEGARQFTKQGSWFKDTDGRYLLFRGVNLSSRAKMPPYIPVYPLGLPVLLMDVLRNELSSVRSSLMLLKRLGFNVVRLVVQWKGIAPYPSVTASREYLEAVTTLVDELFEMGIYSLIDFHQDIASEKFGGDGFPDWAIRPTANLPERIPPVRWWFLRYTQWPIPILPVTFPRLHRRVRETLGSFWNDTVESAGSTLHPRRMLVQSIAATAKAVGNLKGVLGYEPFNEPEPVIFKEEEFERDYLGPFYNEVLAAVDQESFVFVEPRVDWTVRKKPHAIKTYLPKRFPGHKTVLSFHFYDSWTQLRAFLHHTDNMSGKRKLWGAIFDRILAAARERDFIPFMTEFGCDYFGSWLSPVDVNGRSYKTQSRAYMDLSLEQIEAHLLNATLWTFDLYASCQHADNWNDEDSSLLDWHRRVRDPDIVARPYPMRSSAEPKALHFDSQTKHAVIALEGSPVQGAPTVIYVPDEFQYPGGFDVYPTGGRLDWDGNNHLLYWVPDDRLTRHQIVICPQDALDKNTLPSKYQGQIVPKYRKKVRTGAAHHEETTL